MFYLNSLPAPLPVFGVVGEPPHVHVGLDDLGTEDEVFLILASGDSLDSAVKAEGFGSQLQSWGGENRVDVKQQRVRCHPPHRQQTYCEIFDIYMTDNIYSVMVQSLCKTI